MLRCHSGESAKGKYPVQAISTMNRIIQRAEQYERETDVEKFYALVDEPGKLDAMADAVVSAGSSLGAKVIVVIGGKTGETARKIAQARPHAPIVAFVDDQKVARQMQMYRGIHPTLSPSVTMTLSDAVEHAKKFHYVKAGDYVIVVSTEGSEEGGLGSNVTMRIANAV